MLLFLAVALAWGPTAAIAEPYFDPALAANTFWCPSFRCYMEGPLESNATATNECETDDDCVQTALHDVQCGLPGETQAFLPDSRFECALHEDGKNYCVVACTTYYQVQSCEENLDPESEGMVDPDSKGYCTEDYQCTMLATGDTSDPIHTCCPCFTTDCNTQSECTWYPTEPATFDEGPYFSRETVMGTGVKVIDVSHYGADKRPFVTFQGEDDDAPTGDYAIVFVENSSPDGTGTWQNDTLIYTGLSLSLHAVALADADYGAGVMDSRGPSCYKYKMRYYSSENGSLTDESDYNTQNCGGTYAFAASRLIDGVPIVVYTGPDNNGADFMISVNSNDRGTGNWTDYVIRASTGQTVTGPHNCLAALGASAGYGVYYFRQEVESGTITNLWEYSYTTDPTATSGWIHTNLFNDSETFVNRRSVLGVDGTDRPFLVTTEGETNGTGQLTVRRGADTLGTSFSVVATIDLDPGCTEAAVDRTRAILLADGCPAFLAACQDGAVYYVKSSAGNAAGPWTYQLLTSASMAYPPDPHARLALCMTPGTSKPQAAYIDTNWQVVHLQSYEATSF